jgi:flagellar operon protein
MQVYNQNRVMPDIRSIAAKKNTQSQNAQSQNTSESQTFGSILDKTISSNVLFSKHAAARLQNRSINMTDEQIKRVEDGIDKANQKGIKDSLVLVDNLALVVNVKNRVVITAMDENNCNDNVFTNIDGAVIV